MNIVLFADLHGRILLALKLAERLQRERNLSIDLILQCGDVGIFPDPGRFDKATLRHARRDESELGFSRYFAKPHKAALDVLEKLSCNMVCVRGNHEDHDFLNELEQKSTETRFTVDCYQRIFVCKTGKLQTFPDSELSIVGIGRIGQRGNKRPNETQRFMQDYERNTLRALRKTTSHVDILVSHDCPLHFFDKDFGMEEIGDFLQFHKSFYHFFGHTGHPFGAKTDENGFSTSVKIAELEFDNNHTLPYGCMVLLKWQEQFNHGLEVIEDDWLKEYTADSWPYL